MVTDTILGRRTRTTRGTTTQTSDRLSSVERSITIGLPAAELYDLWRHPQVLAKVMAPFAVVTPSADNRLHWVVATPLGELIEWDTQVVEERPGELVRWASTGAIPNEGAIRFRPALGDRGTVASLCMRFSPMAGGMGDFAQRLGKGFVLSMMLEKAVRRFKSLAETGEIPTIERQPAGRNGGRDL